MKQNIEEDPKEDLMDKLDVIATLLTAQEERLVRKIDGVHHDVKTQNSRVGKLEVRTAVHHQQLADQDKATKLRAEQCGERFSGLEIHHRIVKAVNWVGSHKKGTIIAGFILFIMIEALMHHALAQGWLRQMFQFILKLF